MIKTGRDASASRPVFIKSVEVIKVLSLSQECCGASAEKMLVLPQVFYYNKKEVSRERTRALRFC